VHSALQSGSVWPKVIKPNHGNTGIGFVQVRSPDETTRVLESCPTRLACGPVVVEPWLERTMDTSARFELAADGTVADTKLSRCLVTGPGASYGILHVPSDPALNPWRDQLLRTVESVAAALHLEGYFGPVNIDAMVALVDGREVLFPLLEINARQSMSFIGYAVQRRLAPGQPFLLRTLGRKQHRLPGSVAEWRDLLGEAHWNPTRSSGALLFSPPSYRIGNSVHAARRYLLYMTAGTAEALQCLDGEVTGRLRGA
jgi:hypothetical protein